MHALLSAAGLVAVLVVAIAGVPDRALSGLLVAAAVLLIRDEPVAHLDPASPSG